MDLNVSPGLKLRWVWLVGPIALRLMLAPPEVPGQDTSPGGWKPCEKRGFWSKPHVEPMRSVFLLTEETQDKSWAQKEYNTQTHAENRLEPAEKALRKKRCYFCPKAS